MRSASPSPTSPPAVLRHRHPHRAIGARVSGEASGADLAAAAQIFMLDFQAARWLMEKDGDAAATTTRPASHRRIQDFDGYINIAPRWADLGTLREAIGAPSLPAPGICHRAGALEKPMPSCGDQRVHGKEIHRHLVAELNTAGVPRPIYSIDRCSRTRRFSISASRRSAQCETVISGWSASVTLSRTRAPWRRGRRNSASRRRSARRVRLQRRRDRGVAAKKGGVTRPGVLRAPRPALWADPKQKSRTRPAQVGLTQKANQYLATTGPPNDS